MRRLLSRRIHTLMRLPTMPMWRAIERMELRDALVSEYREWEIFCEREMEAVAPQLLDHVVAALSLIQEMDPRRFRRIEGDLHRIFIRRGGGSSYRSLTEVCVLEADLVRTAPPANLALTVVHEAAHARIFKRGIRYRPDLAERIEARCVKEQIAFTRRLGNAGWAVEPMLRYFERRLAGPARTPEAIHAWRMRALKARNAPVWLQWIFETWGKIRGLSSDGSRVEGHGSQL